MGIESTVLSLAGETPVLLRPGGISRQQIEKVIGPIALQTQAPGEAHPSPGMHPRHYSPQTPLMLVDDGELPGSGRGGYVQLHNSPKQPVEEFVQMPSCPEEYAARLYEVLHRLDALDLDWIAVEKPPSTPEWEAVLDRLRRGSSYQSEP